MPDDGLQLIDVVEFETSQPEVTYEYVHKAYTGYQIRYSVPLGDYRFRVRSCIGGPFRYDITGRILLVRRCDSGDWIARRAHRSR